MNYTINKFTALYRSELLENVLPFWEKHARDNVDGGYFTCLLRNGDVYDTDKFTWLQCRQVWTFAMLYNRLQSKEPWLEMALHGSGFLEKYGRDPSGNWYFALDKKGRPLVQPYNIFSDCFAAMAFAQLYRATGVNRYAEIALSTFHNIERRQSNPKGSFNKHINTTRPLQNFALPMILSNLCLELENLLDPALVQKTAKGCVQLVMEKFYQSDLHLVLENIGQDGTLSDSFDGRLINPGHAIEAMGFIIDLGVKFGDQDLIEKAAKTALEMLEYGWDKQYGGIYYFMDRKGYPVQQLEWDQKLWWVHLETLVTLLKAYTNTGNQNYWDWFEKVHNYTWTHFRDPQFGEWFGYLNRQGEVLLPLKGGKWKGCFHVPRSLYQCMVNLQALSDEA